MCQYVAAHTDLLGCVTAAQPRADMNIINRPTERSQCFDAVGWAAERASGL